MLALRSVTMVEPEALSDRAAYSPHWDTTLTQHMASRASIAGVTVGLARWHSSCHASLAHRLVADCIAFTLLQAFSSLALQKSLGCLPYSAACHVQRYRTHILCGAASVWQCLLGRLQNATSWPRRALVWVAWWAVRMEVIMLHAGDSGVGLWAAVRHV